MDNQKNENLIESQKISIIEDYLEKTMVTMPIESSEQERRNYYAGIIDCLNDVGMIDGLQRDRLYLLYVG